MIETTSFSDQYIEEIWDSAERNSTLHTPFSLFRWQKKYSELFIEEGNAVIFFDRETEVIGSFLIHENTLLWDGGKEIADYLDLIGLDSKKPQFWVELIQTSKTMGITGLELHNLPSTSQTLSFFQSLPTSKVTIVQEDTTPFVKLPDTWETYLSQLTRKDRHELERKLRKFERENEMISITHSKPDQRELSQFLSLMKKDERKRAFLTPPMEEFFLHLPEIDPEHLELTSLYIQDHLVAALLGFRYDHVYYLYNSGHEYQKSPGAGFYLNAISIKRAIQDGVLEYNFLQGDERYKYELGGQDFPVFSIKMDLETAHA